MIGFAILACDANEKKTKGNDYLYGFRNFFQPLYKFALGRYLGNIVDVIEGAGLLITLLLKRQSTE
mgnify:CR=1 FL=1